MPRFSANLNMLFPEVPYMERFAQARAAGFTAVEAGFVAADPIFPFEYDAAAAAAELRRLGLRQVLFNVPLGDRTQGDRGIAAHPARREEFREGVRRAIDAAPRPGHLTFAPTPRAREGGGYGGHVGREYKPLGSTRESLLWVTAMGYTF